MDPITHTLVGASLAQTGLKNRTAFGTATLLVGANAPDIDALAYFWGSETAVWFRRGLTHGILSLLILPLVLTAVILILDRLARQRRADRDAARPRQVLLLATLAIATHPLLDFLNSYGMRWLAPFSWTWYYSDTLFIIDPWVWAVLAAGIWLARSGARWPKLGLAVAALYAATMGLSNLAARSLVGRALAAEGVSVERMMAAPLAVTPFTRWVVVQHADGYSAGFFNWLPRPTVDLARMPFDAAPTGPIFDAAIAKPAARRFLSWARFPYFILQRQGGGHLVLIGDARYTLDPETSWASTRLSVGPSGRLPAP